MREQILRCLESGPKTIAGIAEETGLPSAFVRSQVHRMFYVKNPRKGASGEIDNPQCPIQLLPGGKLSVVGEGVHSPSEPILGEPAATISDG